MTFLPLNYSKNGFYRSQTWNYFDTNRLEITDLANGSSLTKKLRYTYLSLKVGGVSRTGKLRFLGIFAQTGQPCAATFTYTHVNI